MPFILYKVELRQFGAKSALQVPLLADDKLVGYLDLWESRRRRDFSDEEIELVSAIARQASLAINNARLHTNLRQSEASLAAAQRIGKMGNWDWNIETGELWWSDEIYRIFDLNPDNYLPTYEKLLRSVHPDDRSLVEQSIQDALDNGKPFNIDHRIMHRRGTLATVHEQAEITRDEHGKPLRMLGTVQDITAIRAAEKQIRQLNDELEQRVVERTAQLEDANKELESFSYSVSHDLRSPLRSIDGFSRILMDDYADALPDDGQRYLSLVREATQQMGRLIDDLLDFSRLGRKALNKREVAPGEIVSSVLETLSPELENRKLELSIGDLPSCQADRALLKQVYVNLISNALKFTGKEEVTRIKISSQQDKGQTVYFVRDNGVGFDMQYADKLFGVFQRLHRAEDFGGSGVGLAIVQRIIHRHGGRIWVESEENKGTTFYFTVGVLEHDEDSE